MHLSDLYILLVEPSRVQRRVIEKHLHALGVSSIRGCDTAEQGLEVMVADPPDLVISALHLSGISGAELLTAMRHDESLRDIAFVLISSETQFRYLDPIKQSGATAILPKPFSDEQLATALKTTLHNIEPEAGARIRDPELLSVLVVDDSPLARKFITKVLSGLGIRRIVEASDGAEALLRLADAYFDLVVTDFNMPNVNGQELTEQIRSNSSQCSVPIMMVTSEKNESRLTAVQQAGVSAICDKPFAADQVKQLLDSLLAHP
ncbi:MAG: two-component system chemotaxis response regulator CheY [Motiliproteus sp.]|jgi:two-component system chemotaxis response regulator CheY